jgi:hypothetical protein
MIRRHLDTIYNKYSLKHNGTVCTTCFNILKLYILHTDCICVFHMVLTINSDCSVNSINRSDFVAETMCRLFTQSLLGCGST